MSDYTTIKQDCDQCHKALEQATAHLRHLIAISYDPSDDWGLSLDGDEAERLVRLLNGVSGLLYHLGNERDAAGALLRQHQPRFENPYSGGAA